ncbi:MAG: kinase/pyrophosphorylase, partial [Enterococcus sp.]
LPEQIKNVPKEKIIGLVIEPDVQQKIRTNRLASLGLDENSRYANIDRIKEEVDYALGIYDELGAFTLDVTNKSIEEAATLICEHLDNSL